MADIEILSRDGTMVSLGNTLVEDLRGQLDGQLLQAGEPDYDDARKIWNGLIDRSPALIARCMSTEDVVLVTNFARENNLLLSVRSGGHNVSGAAIADKGLVVDMSAMRGVQVDEQRQIVKVEGGALLGDVDHETQKFNLAAPLGVVTQTGVAGLTLHGGVGWQVRKHGLSIDNLEAVELVIADGRVLRASAQENEDLFWAVRGGGGNFGVVTEFQFKLHKLGPDVWMSVPIYSLDKANEVLSFCRDYMARAPEELMVIGVYWTAPAVDDVPEQHRGDPVVILLGCYTGPVEAGSDVIGPLRSITEPIADLSAKLKWIDAQKFLDDDYPDGGLYYWKSIYLERFDDEVIATLARHTEKRPSPESSIDVWFIGGAMSRVVSTDTPFYKRDAAVMIGIESNWSNPEDSEANIAWGRAVYDDLERFSDGSSYLNFPGFVENKEKLLQAAYGPNLQRLMDVKSKYDPENLFPGLLNIAPGSGT